MGTQINIAGLTGQASTLPESYNEKATKVNMDRLCPHSWPLDLLRFDDSSDKPLHGHKMVTMDQVITRMRLTKFLFRDVVAANFHSFLFLAKSVFVVASPRLPLLLLA